MASTATRWLLAALTGCGTSSPQPIPTGDCIYIGAPVSIEVGDEHLYGHAWIGAAQDIWGSGVLTMTVCGMAGNDEVWRLDITAESFVRPDAAPPAPLPFTTSDEIDMPTPGVNALVRAHIGGTTSQNATVAGKLIASAGQIHGTAIFGDAGTSATFDGSFTFGCATNEPDPHFLTTFCKQFEALAPP